MPTERKAKTTSTIIFTFNKNCKTLPIIMEIRYCFLLKLCLLFNESNLKKKFDSTSDSGYGVSSLRAVCINFNQYVKTSLS